MLSRRTVHRASKHEEVSYCGRGHMIYISIVARNPGARTLLPQARAMNVAAILEYNRAR